MGTIVLLPEQTAWLESMNIIKYEFDNVRGLVNVDGDVNLYRNNLTTLQGSPREVGGHFYCNNNKLTSLQGSPREVGVGFYCYNNNLTTLQGAPREVGGDFSCYNNNFKTEPDHSFIDIGGEFDWR